MSEQELLELLAAAEHASWSHWMKYLFAQCEQLPDGALVIPPDLVTRWKRQTETEYAGLTEKEKQSDRNRVALITGVINTYAGR